MRLIIVDGIPSWQADDGLVLPVMAGGQDDPWGDDDMFGEGTGNGTTGPTTGETWSAGISRGRIEQLQALQGVNVYEPTSQMWGTFNTRIDRRTGRRVYWLSDPAGGGQAYNLGTSPTLVDPRDLRLYTFAPSGDYQSKIASKEDLARLGLSVGGDGSSGSAAPQWRPGERELEQQRLEQRIEEINLQAQHDRDAAAAAHDSAIAQLEMELASASELQAELIQHQIDLENLTHENDMAELDIRIEAERKNIIYGEVGATKRTMIQEQGAMKRELLGLGTDPSAQLAGIRGMATRGITPQAQAISGANAFINQPLPQVSMDMPLPQMEAALGGMQGMQPPSFGGYGMSGPIGMAKGGTVKTKNKQSVIVGEAGKEIVTGSDFKVTPLAGGAQYGGRIGGVGTTTAEGPDWTHPMPPGLPDLPSVPTPGTPPAPGWVPPWITGGPYPDPLVESMLQNLAPMYAGSPFGQVPRAEGYGRIMGPEGPIPPEWLRMIPRPSGVTVAGAGGMSAMDTMSALGIAPQLVRTGTAAGERHTYYIKDGTRYYVAGGGNDDTLMGLGLNPAQVVQVSPGDIMGLPSGGLFTGTGSQAAGAVPTYDPSSVGAFGVPLIEPTSGVLLRNPKDIAANWQNMSTDQRTNMLSAYQAAGGPFSQTGFGLSPTSVQEIIAKFTPQGRGYGRRIGGVGGQF